MSDQWLQFVLVQAIQIAIVATVAVLVDRLVGDRWPRLRYAMWLAVVIKCLVPPVFRSPTGLFSWTEASLQATHVTPATSSFGLTFNATSHIAQLADPLIWIGVVIWVCGAGVLLTSWFRSWNRFRSATGRTVKGPEYQKTLSTLQRLTKHLHLARTPTLVITSQDFGPAMVGLVRPTIVIPKRLAESLSAEQLEPLIAHELIHVKRRDSFVGLLQMCAAAVWWFHPCVWMAIRKMTGALEMQVDDRTVRETGIAPANYASSLLNAVELLGKPAPIPGSVGLVSCRLTAPRVRNVLSASAKHQGPPVALTVAALCCLILPGRGLSVPSTWLFTPVQCGQFSATFYEPGASNAE